MGPVFLRQTNLQHWPCAYKINCDLTNLVNIVFNLFISKRKNTHPLIPFFCPQLKEEKTDTRRNNRNLWLIKYFEYAVKVILKPTTGHRFFTVVQPLPDKLYEFTPFRPLSIPHMSLMGISKSETPMLAIKNPLKSFCLLWVCFLNFHKFSVEWEKTNIFACFLNLQIKRRQWAFCKNKGVRGLFWISCVISRVIHCNAE